MDNYKDLLLEIFDRTVKESIVISKKETFRDPLNTSHFCIEFSHVNKEYDKTYELLKELFSKIEHDIIENGKQHRTSN